MRLRMNRYVVRYVSLGLAQDIGVRIDAA